MRFIDLLERLAVECGATGELTLDPVSFDMVERAIQERTLAPAPAEPYSLVVLGIVIRKRKSQACSECGRER